MNRDEIKAVLYESLASVAPTVDPDRVDPTADLREEADLDSMDLLNLIIALHKRLGIDIPEVDAPKMVTLDGALDYLAARIEASGASHSNS